MQYVEGLNTIPDDAPDNALYLGTALHTGIEVGLDEAIAEYYANYPIITDAHVNEAIKLETMIPKARQIAPSGFHEVEISDEHFHGFIDLLVPISEEGGIKHFTLYDFKYSNNLENYLKSDQLHLYKYFYEKNHPDCQIDSMAFLMVPKSKCKQFKDEDLTSYRQRLQMDLNGLEPYLSWVDYNPEMVIRFLIQTKELLEANNYPKHKTFLCRYCKFNEFCEKGIDFMLLPENKRRNLEETKKKVIWIYGSPFSGKTTFANSFPDPLMLNTDGNIKFVDAPFIPIKDDVHKEGRMTVRKMAWEVFKDAIAELELKENTFKTIVVDLLEDTYESCRLYMYNQMGITHESDDSFRAWDKVRTEFLSTLKRLMNMDYENIILISHLDSTKDITKKGGDKLTAIKPNINDKVANKVAGMVDIVARAIADEGEYILSFKRSEVIFGGGRLNFKEAEISLNYEAFCGLYDETNAGVPNLKPENNSKQRKDSESTFVPVKAETEPVDEPVVPEASVQAEAEEKPIRKRKRRTEPVEEVNPDDIPF